MENKVAQIDFTLFKRKFAISDDWKPEKTITFRFLPQDSHCHSFNDEPPKSWDVVYKVYYAYEIVERFDNEENVLFSCLFDECSIICSVANHLIKNAPIVGKVHETFLPFGDGITWEIYKDEDPDIVKFVLWKRNNTGYRFFLYQEVAHQFGVFLKDCCEYMLAHGEPI